VIDRTADKAVAVVKFQSSPLQPPRDWEVVCAVHPAHRREKYGLEAVRAAIAYEFTRGRGRIVGIVNRKNKGSRALVEALGFTKGEDRVLQLGNAPEIREHVYEVTPITLRP
jgi:RimJ/RimL family protein N-acetyltransferase